MKELDAAVRTPAGEMPIFAAVPQDVECAPGVLIYMDVFGPREELRDIARRFASCGYAAVLPNLFYRLGSPTFTPIQHPDDGVQVEANRANDATSLEMSAADTQAVVDFAQAGGLGLETRLWGAIGYCMGGRHALSAAVANPKYVRAGVSVHGGRLVDGSADSPHRFVERTTVPLHLMFAHDDPTCPEAHQRLLEDIARRRADTVTVERVDAHHGWSFPERWCFDRPASERVWEVALSMFRATLWTPHEPRRP